MGARGAQKWGRERQEGARSAEQGCRGGRGATGIKCERASGQDQSSGGCHTLPVGNRGRFGGDPSAPKCPLPPSLPLSALAQAWCGGRMPRSGAQQRLSPILGGVRGGQGASGCGEERGGAGRGGCGAAIRAPWRRRSWRRGWAGVWGCTKEKRSSRGGTKRSRDRDRHRDRDPHRERCPRAAPRGGRGAPRGPPGGGAAFSAPPRSSASSPGGSSATWSGSSDSELGRFGEDGGGSPGMSPPPPLPAAVCWKPPVPCRRHPRGPPPCPILGVGVWGCPGSPPALVGGTPPGPLFLAAPSLAPCRSSPWGDPSSMQEGIPCVSPHSWLREGFPVPPVPLQEAPNPKTLAAPTVSLEVGGTPQNLGDETREGDRGANPLLPQIPEER